MKKKIKITYFEPLHSNDYFKVVVLVMYNSKVAVLNCGAQYKSKHALAWCMYQAHEQKHFLSG